MWFKNVHSYKLHSDNEAEAARASSVLESELAKQAARELSGSEARRIGWVPPAGNAGSQFLHELHGHRLITMLRQERILPPAVVREEVEKLASEVERSECRKLRRQERQSIKEQVYEELLPRAFVKSQKVDVWWDTNRGRLVINTASRKRAEEALDLLRETLGSLKVTPLATHTLPIRAMTTWLADPGARPADMVIGDRVELKAKGDDGVISSRQVDLDSDDMQRLMECGRQASKMAIGVEGKLRFVLHDDLALKSLKFDDALIEEANQADDGDDAIVRMETDFLLMCQAMADGIDRVIQWMGGEANTNALKVTMEHES